MSLRITVEELSANSAVITFKGSLTLGTTIGIVDGQLRGLIDRGVDRLIFDLAAVPYCDSSGLGLIVHTFGLTNEKGGMLRLCCLSERVAGVLKMSTTDSFLSIDADKPSAIAALGV